MPGRFRAAVRTLRGPLRGSFSADALPTDGIPDATGTTVVWFGGNGMLLEEGGAFGKAQSAFRLSIKGTNADGSTFRVHQNGNVVFDPDGSPKPILQDAHALRVALEAPTREGPSSRRPSRWSPRALAATLA